MREMQLALREWRGDLVKPRLWAVCFLTAGLFAAIGPAGTDEAFGPIGRVAFWAAAMAAAWVVTTLAAAAASILFDGRPGPSLALTVLIAAPALTSLLPPVHASLLRLPFGPMDWLADLPICALLALVVALKTRLALGQPLGLAVFPEDGAPGGDGRVARRGLAEPHAQETSPAPAPAGEAEAVGAPDIAEAPAAPARPEAAPEPEAEPESQAEPEARPAPSAAAGPGVIAFTPSGRPAARILRRMSHDRRGPLLRLSMNDHYVEIATEAGREMVLMRLGDAIVETAPEPGLQVHRSHWVARRALASAERSGDRVELILTNGERIPVSRGRVAALRDAGWLDLIASPERRDDADDAASGQRA
ncbi:MAG: LytTR family DNA-binding domain-containing protein [Pseudomonadota bacterium]|nr:LytTR family DNA-binding domain-containing protein [Pseudomonadota bacterium]